MIPSELRVVQPQQVQDCGMEIVQSDRAFNCLATKLIGCPIADTMLQSRPGHERREAFRVVIAPAFPQSFTDRQAPKFGSENHQRFAQHATLFQILQQGRRGLIEDQCIIGVICPQILMRVPVDSRRAEVPAVVQLNAAHAAFHKAARQQAVVAVIAHERVVEAIHFLGCLRFTFDVGHFRGAQLHARGKFIGFDAGG